MKRIINILLSIIILSLGSCHKSDAGFIVKLSGKVTNSKTGEPIQGVVISDGFTSVITDDGGVYNFMGNTNANHVFYSVPEMYEVSLKDGAPLFYKRINTSLDSINTNFELVPLENGIESKFTLFCVADPQVANNKNINRLNSETIKDLKSESLKHNTVYGVTLGDLVFDTPELMEDVKEAFISTQIPFFHTIGNHDNIKEYINVFGPTDYSFNRGNVHIVVMNNASGRTGFTKAQISWLKSNLQHVPKNKMLIVCLHIPLVGDMSYRDELLNIIEPYKEVHLMTGHGHRHINYWHDEYNIYEHITGTASGMWWLGAINRCGTPNGYAVYEIDKNSMSNWYYKSVNYPRDFQIKMYAPNTFGDAEGYVVANVWNADNEWSVELLENGVSIGEMEQYTDYDPGTYAFLKSSGLNEPGSRNSPHHYIKTNHLFRLKPMDNNAKISIKATDRFGNVYFQSRLVKSTEEFRIYN